MTGRIGKTLILQIFVMTHVLMHLLVNKKNCKIFNPEVL